MQSNKLKVLAAAVAVATALPMAAEAASNSATGTGALSTNVTMGFNVVIPRFVFLRVGSAASVNTLVYSPSVDDLVSSAAVAATGGDTGLGNSNVTVQVFGNAGNVTLAASNLTSLTSGSNTIPTSTLARTNPTGNITVPAFGANVVLTAVSGVVNEAGSWRYTWSNPASTIYPAGTYVGTATYTATTP